jgi:hypothetical protein
VKRYQLDIYREGSIGGAIVTDTFGEITTAWTVGESIVRANRAMQSDLGASVIRSLYFSIEDKGSSRDPLWGGDLDMRGWV